MFEAERRLIDYTYDADKDLNTLCSGCHSMGRVISERRTKDEWVGLMNMHRFFYPGIDGASGGFRQGGPGPEAAGAGGAAMAAAEATADAKAAATRGSRTKKPRTILRRRSR